MREAIEASIEDETMAMGPSGGSESTSATTTEWKSWCDEKAMSSAAEVGAVLRAQYPSILGPRSSSSSTSRSTSPTPTLTMDDLVKRFLEVFTQQLHTECSLSLNGQVNGQMNGQAHVNHSHSNANGESALQSSLANGESREVEDLSDQEPTTPVQPTPARKPFYRRYPTYLNVFYSAIPDVPIAYPRLDILYPGFIFSPFCIYLCRLSFKGFKKGRLFHKQLSDEVQLSSGETKSKGDKNSKAKLAKIVVECPKEGTVHYLSGENLDGSQKWAKCRLVLVKTVGGYMLEFYSPPKVRLFSLVFN